MPDRNLEAAIAVTRFGLGARPGEIAAAAEDPRGFLLEQIRPEGADIPASNGRAAAERLADFQDLQQGRSEMRRAGRSPREAGRDDPVKVVQRMLRQDTAGDFMARARLAAETPAGFRERWALFWANHFTVSATKAVTAVLVGPFENDAVRPHVFGRFEDLLAAAVAHQGMLLYLDQATSIGPNSRAARFMRTRGGRSRGVGLNENLAREILELHTVGVDGGYSQADVTEFARALTGLSVGGYRAGEGRMGERVYRANAHEPGERTVMGVRYPDLGRDQAGAILTDLAVKPQTARFVCRKIARHFTGDEPPPALVARLERSWLATGGALDAVARTLVTSPEAWTPEAGKLKTPYEFMASTWRALDVAPQRAQDVIPVLGLMGQKAFAPPSPEGWPDDVASWAGPDALITRMTWAQAVAERAAPIRDPVVVAGQALGARLRPATQEAVRRAESRAEGLALLLMSPEFQRR